MSEPPVTRPSLLVRLRQMQDTEAWRQFVDAYAPLVYGYARKHGLQDADAADVTQEVLRTVAAAIGRLQYDPAKGGFRRWLFTVTRHKLLNFLAFRERPGVSPPVGGTTMHELLEQQPAPDGEAALWDQEYERRLFTWATEQSRGDFANATWQAFWQTAVEGKTPKVVADSLGISVGAVYIAKSRVLARLKQTVRELQE